MSLLLSPTIWADHRLDWGQRTHVMGIINVTPDSFSGDGLAQLSPSPQASPSQEAIVQQAVTRALTFVSDGATIIDVGGESTRPHAEPVSVEQELARVLPIISALNAALPKEIIISIDTYKAEVARAALDAGASLINDIWGLHGDAAMATLVSERRVPIVLMANMRGYEKRE
ncbi:MAG TPA: dihydropteroate synthase, partial [Ktedonobacteraceae bacterium]|nr:dihydropteroate synthase [Ktedonobacteraceae bacterium]